MAAFVILAYLKFKLVAKAVAACVLLGAIGYVILFIVNLTSAGIENSENFLGHPDETIERLRKE